MGFPQDDSTTYFLRNSHTQYYLYVSGSSLTLNAEKVDDAFYRWRFIKDGNTSNYNLQNVGNNQYFNIGNYSTSPYSGYTVFMSTTTHALHITGGSVFKMGINGSSQFCISDVGGAIYAVNGNYSPSRSQAARDEWHFEAIQKSPLVDKNPLPKGTYRIRSFNGSYLLTMPQVARGDVGNPYVSQQDQSNDFQKWSLVPEGDSLYTIRNSGTGLYLAGSSAKLVKGDRLVGQSVANGDTPFQWRIETFGPGVMFFIGLNGDCLSIGFPNYMAEDLSLVALQPSDNIPSQIWFFETFEALSPAIFHATRQLVPGTYILESCHTQQYICVSTDDFVVATSDHTNATNFNLEFVTDHRPDFTLSYSDANYGTFYLSVDKHRLLTSDEDDKSTWVLLPREYQGVGTVYFICDSTPTDPRRVISCRKVKDRKRSYFALDPLTEGEAMQFWKFRKACSADGRS